MVKLPAYFRLATYALYAQHGRYLYGESPERGLASAYRSRGQGVMRSKKSSPYLVNTPQNKIKLEFHNRTLTHS